MRFLGHYILEYFKIGKFALWLVLTACVLAGFRFFDFTGRVKLTKRSILILICILGIALRLFWLSYSTHVPRTSWGPSMIENDLIHMHAIGITEDKWFLNEDGTPSARRPIGYPIVLGLLYKCFGVHLYVAWIFHLVLFLLTLAVLYRLAVLMFDERTALISAFLFAINPISIFSIKLITDEHLFLFLWYGGLLLLFSDIEKNRLQTRWPLYGVIFGVAAMTRTYAIFMPLIVAIAYGVISKNIKKALSYFLLTLLTMQVLNLPWVIRNYRIWHVPVLYAVAGHSLYYSTNPSSTPQSDGHPTPGENGYSPQFEAALAASNEGLMQKYANEAIVSWITRDPIAFVDLGVSKVLYFMHWGKQKGIWPFWFQFQPGHFEKQIPEKTMKKLENYTFFFYYMIFHFFVLSIILLWIRRHTHRTSNQKLYGNLIVLCMVCWLLLQMIIMPDPKYRWPLEPLMSIFASFFISFIMTSSKSQKKGASLSHETI